MPETLKSIEKSLEAAKVNKKDHNSKYKKPQVNGSAASVEPIENKEHKDDPEKFMTDFEWEQSNQSKQTKQNTFGAFSIQASALPEITQENLPIWAVMKEEQK